jgi:hypothetical protein
MTPTTSGSFNNMHVHDPYKGMEVIVIYGDLKSRYGTIIDTREKGKKEWATVLMENILERLSIVIEVDHLLERLYVRHY